KESSPTAETTCVNGHATTGPLLFRATSTPCHATISQSSRMRSQGARGRNDLSRADEATSVRALSFPFQERDTRAAVSGLYQLPGHVRRGPWRHLHDSDRRRTVSQRHHGRPP